MYSLYFVSPFRIFAIQTEPFLSGLSIKPRETDLSFFFFLTGAALTSSRLKNKPIVKRA